MRILPHILLSFLCSLTILAVQGQQFAVHLANMPHHPLDLYVFCCGKRAKIYQGQACVAYQSSSCPTIVNLIITPACRPVFDQPVPWLERDLDVCTLWYQLELVDCPQGYTWRIVSIPQEQQPAYIPDRAVIVHMPTEYVEKVAMPGEGKDYLISGSVMKSQALVHLPTIYLKNMSSAALSQLQEDLNKAHLCCELDMAHEQLIQSSKQVGSKVLTLRHGIHTSRKRQGMS